MPVVYLLLEARCAPTLAQGAVGDLLPARGTGQPDLFIGLSGAGVPVGGYPANVRAWRT